MLRTDGPCVVHVRDDESDPSVYRAELVHFTWDLIRLTNNDEIEDWNGLVAWLVEHGSAWMYVDPYSEDIDDRTVWHWHGSHSEAELAHYNSRTDI